MIGQTRQVGMLGTIGRKKERQRTIIRRPMTAANKEELQRLKLVELKERVKSLEEENEKLRKSRDEIATSCEALVAANRERDRVVAAEAKKADTARRGAESRAKRADDEKAAAEQRAAEAESRASKAQEALESERRDRESTTRREVERACSDARASWEKERAALSARGRDAVKLEQEVSRQKVVQCEQRIAKQFLDLAAEYDLKYGTLFKQCSSRVRQLSESLASLEASVARIKESSIAQLEAARREKDSKVAAMTREHGEETGALRREVERLRSAIAEADEKHAREMEAVCDKARAVIAKKDKAQQQRDVLIARLQGELTGLSRLAATTPAPSSSQMI